MARPSRFSTTNWPMTAPVDESRLADFSKSRAAAGPEFNANEALRAILARAAYCLSAAPDLTGPGPWRLGQDRHGCGVAAVFLLIVQLAHIASRTDQFPMYIMGDADAFSIGPDSRPVLTAVTGGDHFHNTPGAPHAFLPKVGRPSGPELGNRVHRDHAA